MNSWETRPNNLPPRSLSPTAALLLDAENFSRQLDLEKYLKGYCNYPLAIKLAVANWQNKSLANLDLILHKQRYQLIHVPKAKNAADAQILTLGTSLLFQYPQITEVIIVSNDSIFDYLHKTLISLGCKTYKVYQKSKNIYVQDFLNNRTDVIAIAKEDLKQKNNNSNSVNQSPTDIFLCTIESLLKEIAKNKNTEVPLNVIGKQFKDKYKKSLSETLKSKQLGTSPSKFFKNNSSNKIKINQKNNTYYLALN